MIARYWSGTVPPDKVSEYSRYLESSVLPELRELEGYEGGMLLQRKVTGTVEVVVMTFWRSLDSVRAFARGDVEDAVVGERAAAILNDFDRRVRHYEVALQFNRHNPET
jgi:heme-degrading monooxygenase HmoA